MRRRDFIGLLGGAAVAGPLAVRAQQTGRRPVVGLVFASHPLTEMTGPDPVALPARAFVHRLRDLGWVEGRTIIIERRSAEGQLERAQAILAELAARGVDVIVVGSAGWMREAARRAARTIPIIAIFTEDPVAAGLVPSLARPGGNLTGVTSTTGRELYEKRLQLLKELAPGIARLAFLGNRPAWESYLSGADVTVVPPVFAPVDRPEEYEEAFAIVSRERADGLLVSHGPIMYFGIPRIVAFAAERRLPAVYAWREAVEAGGLMSYGPNVLGIFRQLAGFVDRILKGAKPDDLPIEQPTVFELVINGKTAKALGLEVPPSLLLRAEEVIE